MTNSVDNAIKLGSIVTVKGSEGFYRVSRVNKETFNLSSVWGNNVYYKGLEKFNVCLSSENEAKQY